MISLPKLQPVPLLIVGICVGIVIGCTLQMVALLLARKQMINLPKLNVVLLLLLAGILMGLGLGRFHEQGLKNEAIYLHHARHNPITGDFEWFTNSLPENFR